MKQTPLKEIYNFQCTCCGDCCTGNMEININIYDLYKLAVRFGMTSTGELFEKGFIKLVQVQNGCWTPQIIFKTQPFQFCPWLINDLGDDEVLRGFCSLHPFDKPLICKMAPAGRVVDFDYNQISYMLTPPTESCPGMEIKHENTLSVLKKELHDELELEYRYYAILENLEKKAVSELLMRIEFYTFRTDRKFEDILSEMERKAENLN
jgi:hypothetical protein